LRWFLRSCFGRWAVVLEFVGWWLRWFWKIGRSGALDLLVAAMLV